jgi:MFS family permease
VDPTGGTKRGHDDGDYPSPAVAWSTVGVLSVAYLLSIMDRHILVLLIEPIKADLGLSDTQVSLVTGFAFAVVYTIMGVPLARLADLWMRKHVIVIGVTIWSLLTLASGFARSFGQLFLARMGVGFGEAGLTSPAYAMVADLFPPRRLAFAMSVFVLGGVVGIALSLMLGGLVIQYVAGMQGVTLPIVGEISSWRLVLVIAGAATLAVALPLALVREPVRRAADGAASSTFGGLLRYMWDCRAFYAPFIVASCLRFQFDYGTAAWMPTYFIRLHGWEAGATGLIIGGIMLAPYLVGGLCSGVLADRLGAKGYRAASLHIMTVSGPLSLAMLVVVIYVQPMPLKLVALALSYLLYAMYAVLHPTVIQMATPNRMRAQVSAVVLFAMNLIGLGFGATAVALVTDYLFADDRAVGHSMVLVGFVAVLVSTLAFSQSIRPFLDRVAGLSEETTVSGMRNARASAQG